MYLLYLLLKMVNFQLSHLGLSPKPVAPRWISAQVPCDRPSRRGLQLTRPKLQQLHAPRRHQWDHPPENGATLPASAKSSPTLQGGMEGGDGVPTNGRGGVEHSTRFCLALKRFLVNFLCYVFCSKNIASVQGKENILNTRLIPPI